MRRSHRGMCLGIVIGLSTTLAIEPTQGLEPKSNSRRSEKSTPSLKPPTPTVTPSKLKAKPSVSFKALVKIVVDQFQRVPQHAITRTSDTVCPIAPGLIETGTKIFSDRPLFVWQGQVDSIEVQDYWTAQILWSQSLLPGVTTQQYSGPPLQGGQKYVWILKRDQTSLVSKEFIVMPLEEQNTIIQKKNSSANLNRLVPQKLSDAAYFAENSLWSDSLRSLSQTSDDRVTGILDDQIQLLAERLCQNKVGNELAFETLP